MLAYSPKNLFQIFAITMSGNGELLSPRFTTVLRYRYFLQSARGRVSWPYTVGKIDLALQNNTYREICTVYKVQWITPQRRSYVKRQQSIKIFKLEIFKITSRGLCGQSQRTVIKSGLKWANNWGKGVVYRQCYLAKFTSASNAPKWYQHVHGQKYPGVL